MCDEKQLKIYIAWCELMLQICTLPSILITLIGYLLIKPQYRKLSLILVILFTMLTITATCVFPFEIYSKIKAINDDNYNKKLFNSEINEKSIILLLSVR